MRRRRTALGLTLLAAVAAIGLSACSGDSGSSLPRPNKASCTASYTYDQRLPKLVGKVDEQIALVEPIAANAPKDVKADAELFLDALRRVASGDKSVVDNKRVERAATNVNRRAADGCGLYNQDPSSGI